MYYLNCFFIYSFIGFLYENIINYIKHKKFGSGMLYGPWTPIYGLGAVLILIISKFLFNILNLNKYLEILIILIILIIILTILELIGGILIEKIFHVTFWDYSNFKFHIGKYIALEISFIWGCASIILIYILNPTLSNFINLVPNFITYILLILIIIDFILTFYSKKVHR